MACPFLKEAQVKYCRTAAVRKLIPLAQTGSADEKCSSAAHASCSVFRTQPEGQPASGPCPYLCESLMQYCSAAPVTRFIPYSESGLSRCGNDSYRYCELYLSMAHPKSCRQELSSRQETSPKEADSLELPGWLQYSANHMWLDVSSDGTCHAGIDAFLSRVLGKIDGISYLWLGGRRRPAAVLTVAGTDLEIVFPNPFLITRCNLYLRADPSPISTEPYTGGWLFEGVPDAETTDGLYRGPEACEWMEEEQRRMSEFLQEGQKPGDLGRLAADGGLFAEGAARRLDRDRMLSLFHEFFSPYAGGQRAGGKRES